MVARKVIKRGRVAFQTQGRLLQELGERLVASPQVALVELVKNAYDADATKCDVRHDGDSVVVSDDGHGMTEKEFIDNWMHIATPEKQHHRQSKSFKRIMTGAKGIGRFAVRFLGKRLRIETIANDKGRRHKTLLEIEFDWAALDKSSRLHQFEIPYRVLRVGRDRESGTTLKISDLRDPSAIAFNKALRTEVLGIVSPLSGLDRGNFDIKSRNEEDPGFKLHLPGEDDETNDLNLAKEVLSNAFARLTISHENNKVIYRIRHKDGRTLLRKKIRLPSHINNGLFADIRFFPRRAGMFHGVQVNGWEAWKWIKANSGVAVVDHGFRIRPYGYEEDDWLHQSKDKAHNRREWRSKVMERLYPMLPEATEAANNPMLYLPGHHQLVGAIFVESNQEWGSERPKDLTPSTDREGFLHNEGYKNLFALVRTGIEMIALTDHKEQRRVQQELAHQEAASLRKDFKAAITHIEALPTLTPSDKRQVISHFQTLSRQLGDVEDYYRQATSEMETMSLLGVLAGFMTHEAKRLVFDFEQVVRQLRKLKRRDSKVAHLLPKIERTLGEFKGQMDYSALFIGSLQNKNVKHKPFKAYAQAKRVDNVFKNFREARSIDVDIQITKDVMAPAMPVAMYSGILMNLYTNALKAVVAGPSKGESQKVFIKGWNENGKHILEVADNGVGIPPELEKRIWDPLFTTTSGQMNNPLGSGMGLGLPLVRKLLKGIGGALHLVDPPPNCSTCFRAEFRKK